MGSERPAQQRNRPAAATAPGATRAVELGRARVVLRVRPLPDVFDLALRVCSRNGAALGRLTLVLLLPAWAACVALHHLAKQSYWIVWPVAVVLATVLQGAFTVAAGQLLFEKDAGVRVVLARFGRRLGSYLVALALFRLPAAVAIYGLFRSLDIAESAANALWILPIIGLLLARQVFVQEVVLLEGSGPWPGRKRTVQLLKGYVTSGVGLVLWWIAALTFCIGGADVMAGSLIRYGLQLGEPFGAFAEIGGSPFALAGLFLAVPMVATARFLVYLDLRTRKEGWDLQLRFATIEAHGRNDNAPAQAVA